MTSIDIRIDYQKGSPIAFLCPLTASGRSWLSDHVKGKRINSSAILDAGKLLPLIKQMQQAKLNLHWKDTI